LTTFDILADVYLGEMEQVWFTKHELAAKCRHCDHLSVFSVRPTQYEARGLFRKDGLIAEYPGSANNYFRVLGPVTIRDVPGEGAPDLVPAKLSAIFLEGTSSLVGQCFNAAGAMFRLCLDLATKALLPLQGSEGEPTSRERRELASRLRWLFENKLLPEDLRELATAVREDGNDAAHDGTLTEAEARDLLDFTTVLLERLYTQPGRVAAARARRADRNQVPEGRP
jgi:hypothetical protein